MHDDHAFLRAIEQAPHDDGLRLIYADWLDEHDDIRGTFVRLHLALQSLSPDHLHYAPGEQELSYYRQQIDPAWLAIIEPEQLTKFPFQDNFLTCSCFKPCYDSKVKWTELELHNTPQDTECAEWYELLERIDEASAKQATEFALFPHRETILEVERQDLLLARRKIVTLPASIVKLQAVRRINCYGSFLERLPPEIGLLTQLESLDLYSSYRLHWLPYELTWCTNLRDSKVSTRALYGNYKYHPPFPRLQPPFAYRGGQRVEPERLMLQHFPPPTQRPCSVCRKPFVDQRRHRVWVTLCVGSDDWPLLVNACSPECLAQLPTQPTLHKYSPKPHRGGLSSRPPPN